MTRIKISMCVLLSTVSLFFFSIAKARSLGYDLVIEEKEVNFTGKPAKAMTINGTVPGPILYMTEGDTVTLRIHNKMKEETSIHWHGILLPNREDGVPYLTTPPIKPGQTYTYKFPIIQSGTFWYHSHSGLQEQQGIYGAFIIYPIEEHIKVDKEYVLVLSDWINQDPHEVLRTLKRGSDYYSLKKGSIPSIVDAMTKHALFDYFKLSWIRMPAMDISDVAYDAFLANGRQESQIKAQPGETIRLRIINAAAATYFYLQFAGGPMSIISADGSDVEEVNLNRFLIAIAETYDVLVTVPESGAYEFRATAQDGSGQSSLFIGDGEKFQAPDVPKPNLYKMDMDDHEMGMMEHNMMGHSMEAMEMEEMDEERPLAPYSRLSQVWSTALPEDRPWREIRFELTGDMERFVWSIDGKTVDEADYIRIKRGENVRFILINKTMMHHPMHLHGHLFRVVNQYGDFSPLKHTVDVAPMARVIMEFQADEEKDWFFHCHILYHMLSGMARVVHYQGSTMDPDISPIRHKFSHDLWFSWLDISILSQMSEGRAVVLNTRNTFALAWEANWHESYDIEITHERYFDQFLTGFGGINVTDSIVHGFFGFQYLLPLLIETRVWIDTKGDIRFTATKEIQVASRLGIFGNVEYDTESKWEWLAGAEFTLTKMFSLICQYQSDYGVGAGLTLRL